MNKELKAKLDALVARLNTPAFIENDPVRFPRMFTERHDIEIAAFLVSMIAWGNRKQIMNACQRMLFDIMGGRPYRYVMDMEFERLDPDMSIHRTFFGRDLIYMCRGLEWIYTWGDSLERFFTQGDIWQGIHQLRESIVFGNDCKANRHFPDPSVNSRKDGSACKRVHLMLRWLVRDDGIVDMGIWRAVKPSSLMIPLDVHVGRMARGMGLLTRKRNDRIAVEELTERLRDLDEADPVKYDFALFGMGVEQKRERP